jgi:hypothetical protein
MTTTRALANLGGYQVPITNDQLTRALKYGRNEEWNWEDRNRTRTINDYYNVPFAGY